MPDFKKELMMIKLGYLHQFGFIDNLQLKKTYHYMIITNSVSPIPSRNQTL